MESLDNIAVFVGIAAFCMLAYTCLNYRKMSKLSCILLLAICVVIGFSAFGVAVYFKFIHLFKP